MARHPGWEIFGLFVILAGPLAYWMNGRRADAEQRIESTTVGVPQAERDEFVTSDKCEACHPSQYASWHRGYHRSMTQYATPATVKGDFNDLQLVGGGYDVKLWRQGDDFMVDMVDPLWQYEVDAGQRQVAPGELPPRVQRRISLVTGSHHMQAYWVSSNVGNGQLSLPFTYLLEDKRWVPRGEVFLHEPDERHQEQVWNVSCILCHSTAGQPNALVGGKAVKSDVGEMGIACEACHGPAQAHVAANRNPLRRYWLHLAGGGDPTIVNPARLPMQRASEVCGQCHSLTDVSEEIELGAGKQFRPGDQLEATQPLLRALHPTPALEKKIAEDPNYLRGYFWADGTGRVSSRDYSGMLESKCMQSNKLWCGSCHSLHDADPNLLVSEGKDTDAACTGCHPQIGANVAAHTHHQPSSVGSRCYNCHMPHTIYGLLKGIRNHRIDSPHVTAPTGGNDRPNACNLCHVDRSLGWSAEALARWYKQPVPQGLTDETPAAVQWMLAGDAVQRAIGAWHFGWADARKATNVEAYVPYLVAALDDPYAAVRYVAGHALQAIDPAAEYDYLAPPEARRQAADKILMRWRAKSPDNERAMTEASARIQQLIRMRDDTPVRAME